MATVAEILLERARQQGEARRQQGAIAGQTWSNLANIIANTGKQIETERVEAPIRAQEAQLRDVQIKEGQAKVAEQDRVAKGDAYLKTAFAEGKMPTANDLISNLGPERGIAVARGMSALRPDPVKDFQNRQGVLRDVLLGMNALPEDVRATHYGGIRQNLIQRGVITEKDAPEAYDKDWWTSAVNFGKEPPKAEPFTLKPGETRFDATGKPVANVAPIAPKAPNSQSENFILDGKQVKGDYVPGTAGAGGKYFYNGQDVTARVKPIPPAAIQGAAAAATAVSNLPPWALDASRPVGTEGNVLNAQIGMTPNGLFQDAQNYIATGQYPRMSMRGDAQSQAKRAAIDAKVGAIAAEAGMDVPTLRAFYASNKASIGQQQKMQDSVQSFMATADKNSELLEKTLKKIPDIGSPLFNAPIRAFSKNVMGNPDLAQFSTYLQSIQNEYAKILTQPNLAGQLTDSARHEAEQLIRPDATVQQMIGSLQALRAEGTNRLISTGEQIRRIQDRMQHATDAGVGGSSAASPTVRKYNPATGKLE